MDAIEVLSPGLQTTIQDGGRPGFLSKGIPPAGAQDVFSLGMANLLVGNSLPPPPLTPGDPGDAGLEMLLTGPTLRFQEETVVAVTGAQAKVKLNGAPIETWEAIRVKGGDVLECSRLGPGMRAYLAVAGGFDVPALLGSRSTFCRGSQGGLHGRVLRKGDRIPVGSRMTILSDLEGRRIRTEVLPKDGAPWTIRVVEGPQIEMFTEPAIEQFFSAEWSLSPTSDRMGFRFVGPQLHLKDRPHYLLKDAGSGPADIVDDVIPVGGIQVAGGIEPIAMGVENPSVGGYAKIGTVISADYRVLGQMRPAEVARFERVGLDDAVQAGRQQMALVGEGALA